MQKNVVVNAAIWVGSKITDAFQAVKDFKDDARVVSKEFWNYAKDPTPENKKKVNSAISNSKTVSNNKKCKKLLLQQLKI